MDTWAECPARGVGRRQALLVLQRGLAGEPVRTSAAHLYPERAVRQLCAWPTLSLDEVADLGPGGVLVGRRALQLPPTDPAGDVDRPVHALDDSLVAQVEGGWVISEWPQCQMQRPIAEVGWMPFVCTVGGFVAVCANLTGFAAEPRGAAARAPGRPVRLLLDPPGSWQEEVRGHRLLVGRGGPWVHVEARRLANRRRLNAINAKYGTRY
ncbi:MAG TPA: hypothetical protein VFK34_01700 [Marmoricola sp.]|nr:hypothetical protein [Marmoricola sp.]